MTPNSLTTSNKRTFSQSGIIGLEQTTKYKRNEDLKSSLLNSLPDELLNIILSFLDLCEINSFICLSKSLKDKNFTEIRKVKLKNLLVSSKAVAFSKKLHAPISNHPTIEYSLIKRSDDTWTKARVHELRTKVWKDQSGKFIERNAFIPDEWEFVGYNQIAFSWNEFGKTISLSDVLYLSQSLIPQMKENLSNAPEKLSINSVLDAILPARQEQSSENVSKNVVEAIPQAPNLEEKERLISNLLDKYGAIAFSKKLQNMVENLTPFPFNQCLIKRSDGTWSKGTYYQLKDEICVQPSRYRTIQISVQDGIKSPQVNHFWYIPTTFENIVFYRLKDFNNKFTKEMLINILSSIDELVLET